MIISRNIIENVAKEAILVHKEDKHAESYIREQREVQLNYLYALVLFLYNLDKLKDSIFTVKNNLFYLPVYLDNSYPFDFLCQDLGLKDTFTLGGNGTYSFNETSEQVKIFLEVFERKIKQKKETIQKQNIEERFKGFYADLIFHLKKDVTSCKYLPEHYFPVKLKELPVEEAHWLNEVVAAYKNDPRYKRAKITDKKFFEKYHKTCSYFTNVLESGTDFLVFSIQFRIQNQHTLSGNLFRDFKHDFLNYRRGYKKLASIAGSIGYWELDQKSNLAFRMYFIVPDIGLDVMEWQEDIIYYWENILFDRFIKKYKLANSNLVFMANSVPLSLSYKNFKGKSIKISKKHKARIQDFCQTVVAYIVLSELYFYPYPLQLRLHAVRQIDSKVDTTKPIVITNKNKTSRVFRGHIKKENTKD
ncbi:MAG: hypothetical protein EOO69_09210 [Moraxellaceae bacterium]|nr:MAG: hypothetical protein EOO69_09210 [Moraxellaceae bacterium]